MTTIQDSADSFDKAMHYSLCLYNIYLHLAALPCIRVAGEYPEGRGEKSRGFQSSFVVSEKWAQEMLYHF